MTSVGGEAYLGDDTMQKRYYIFYCALLEPKGIQLTSVGGEAYLGDDTMQKRYYIFYCALLEPKGIQLTYSTAQNRSKNEV